MSTLKIKSARTEKDLIKDAKSHIEKLIDLLNEAEKMNFTISFNIGRQNNTGPFVITSLLTTRNYL